MDERLLSVNVFAGVESGDHHRTVVKVRGVNDDGIELVEAVGKGLTVVRDAPAAAVGVVVDLGEGRLIDIAEAGPLDHGMTLESFALHVADAVDPDLEKAKLAVFVRRGTHGGGIRGEETGTQRRCGAEEVTAAGGSGSGRGFRAHGRECIGPRAPWRVSFARVFVVKAV